MTKPALPADFDPETYLRLNEDVRRAGEDAKTHYLIHGYKEGRMWKEDPRHFERDYNTLVAGLMAQYPLEEAMSRAVGGSFDDMGIRQIDLLERTAGLRDGIAIVDFGCGSGRTASKIAARFPNCAYVGLDVVPAMLGYAASICPPHYRFISNTQLAFPLEDNGYDLVIAFSVFTHLIHDESYAYLQDAVRILKPCGAIAFSFLEFARPHHWAIFADTVECRKTSSLPCLNSFIERSVIEVWCKHLHLAVGDFLDTEIGQTYCVLRKTA